MLGMISKDYLLDDVKIKITFLKVNGNIEGLYYTPIFDGVEGQTKIENIKYYDQETLNKLLNQLLDETIDLDFKLMLYPFNFKKG